MWYTRSEIPENVSLRWKQHQIMWIFLGMADITSSLLILNIFSILTSILINLLHIFRNWIPISLFLDKNLTSEYGFPWILTCRKFFKFLWFNRFFVLHQILSGWSKWKVQKCDVALVSHRPPKPCFFIEIYIVYKY